MKGGNESIRKRGTPLSKDLKGFLGGGGEGKW